jgi:hypothetical protein
MRWRRRRSSSTESWGARGGEEKLRAMAAGRFPRVGEPSHGCFLGHRGCIGWFPSCRSCRIFVPCSFVSVARVRLRLCRNPNPRSRSRSLSISVRETLKLGSVWLWRFASFHLSIRIHTLLDPSVSVCTPYTNAYRPPYTSV